MTSAICPFCKGEIATGDKVCWRCGYMQPLGRNGGNSLSTRNWKIRLAVIFVIMLGCGVLILFGLARDGWMDALTIVGVGVFVFTILFALACELGLFNSL